MKKFISFQFIISTVWEISHAKTVLTPLIFNNIQKRSKWSSLLFIRFSSKIVTLLLIHIPRPPLPFPFNLHFPIHSYLSSSFVGLEFDLRNVSARPIKSTLSRSETLLSSRTLLLKPRILRKSKVSLLSLGSRFFLRLPIPPRFRFRRFNITVLLLPTLCMRVKSEELPSISAHPWP